MSTNVAVTIGARRWVCVVDPSLAFASEGPRVVRALSRTLEVWVFRELWHILDNTVYFTRTPTALAPGGDGGARERSVLAALAGWERLRYEHDLNGLRVFWVGDGLTESFLPEHHDARLVARFEQLAAALEARQGAEAAHVGGMAFRDTAALAVALDEAVVLVRGAARRGADEEPPAMIEALTRWGIACMRGDPDHPLLELERRSLWGALVDAGLARMCLTGLGLAVVHLVLPAGFEAQRPSAGPPDPDTPLPGVAPLPEETWSGARAVWYPLC